MIKIWQRGLKRLGVWDIVLIKFSMIVVTLFVITIWSGAMDWVQSIHWGWFLAAGVVFGAVPFYKVYLK